MDPRLIAWRTLLTVALLTGGAGPASSQQPAPGVIGRVSVYVDAVSREALDGARSQTTEINSPTRRSEAGWPNRCMTS